MTSLGSGLQHSIGQRGPIITTGLFILTVYSGKECFDGLVGVAKLIARVAICGKNIFSSAYTLDWNTFYVDSKKHISQMYQPTCMSEVEQGKFVSVNDGPSATKMVLNIIKKVGIAILVYDLCRLAGGASKLEGPAYRLANHFCSNLVRRVQKFNFPI